MDLAKTPKNPHTHSLFFKFITFGPGLWIILNQVLLVQKDGVVYNSYAEIRSNEVLSDTLLSAFINQRNFVYTLYAALLIVVPIAIFKNEGVMRSIFFKSSQSKVMGNQSIIPAVVYGLVLTTFSYQLSIWVIDLYLRMFT